VFKNSLFSKIVLIFTIPVLGILYFSFITVMEKVDTLNDFKKIEIRVALVEKVEIVPKADKLYTLQLDLGYEKRTIVSNIRESYKPKELEGKKIAVICNLKPAKIRGVTSNGMLLAVESPNKANGTITLLTVMDDSIPVGSKIN